MNPLEHIQASILRRRLKLPIWLLLAGLVLALGAFGWAGKGYLPVLLWFAAVAVSGIGAALAFTRVRPSADDAARQLDAELNAKNRFEAAAELANKPSPLADAQRAETQAHYANLKPARLLALPIMLALIALLVSNLGFLVGWLITIPSFEPLPELAELPEPEAPAPLARFEWIEPDPEITATPLEVVPLTAGVQSESGLENVELVIAVNGKELERMPVETDLSEPGQLALAIDLYLDMFELEPFDMVTYYLQGDRIFERELPPTVSNIQFVQIRPFRDDVARVMMPGGSGPMMDISNLIKEIKLAQLTLLKQNFLLAHADRDNAVWPVENEKVAAEQATLVDKTNEVIDVLTQLGAPGVIVDLLAQSKQPMIAAADAMGSTENQEAIAQQGKALGLITEIEKHIQKMIMESQGGGGEQPPSVKDPFAEQEKYHLPPREQTPAGQLEELAQEQRELLEKLDQAKPEEAAEKQEEIAEKLSELAQSGEFEGEVGERVEDAAQAAAEGQQQLDAGDKTAAREPGARALANMEEAMRAMREQAQAEAQALIADAQRALNDAAREAESGEGEPSNSEGESAQASNEPGEQPGGQSPGEQPGQSPGKGESPGQGQSPSESAQASNSPGQGQSPGEGQSPGQGEGQGEAEGQGQGQGQGQGESMAQSQGQGKGKGQGEGQGEGEGEKGQGGQGKGNQGQGNGYATNPQYVPEPQEGHGGRNGMVDVVTDENRYLQSAQAAALAREALRQAALRQQQIGSEELALLLAQLAEKMSEGIKDLELGKDPAATMQKLSDQAAEALIAIEERRQVLTMARDELRRAAANLQRLSAQKQTGQALYESTGDLLSAAQLSKLLLQGPIADESYKRLWTGLAVNEPVAGGTWKTAEQPVQQLIALLDEQLASLTRKSVISLGNADTAPEAYREAVSAYFERLANTAAEDPPGD